MSKINRAKNKQTLSGKKMKIKTMFLRKEGSTL
jgi:hypothetical protein